MLSNHPAYHELHEDEETNDPRRIKQRTERWLDLRKQALVTGSTLYAATGLDGLKKQKEYFDKVICKVEEEKSNQVKKNMEYGTNNEINAIATLVTKVLPVLHPCLEYREEGCIPLYREDKFTMIVSPDGSLEGNSEVEGKTTKMAIELKCPVSNLHTNVPERYILQCLSEMYALQVHKLLYLCWRPDVSSVFELSFNQSLFQDALEECLKIVDVQKPKRPVKISKSVQGLKKRVQEESVRASFMGEFPSAVRSDSSSSSSTFEFTKVYILNVLEKIISLMKDGNELQRQKAS